MKNYLSIASILFVSLFLFCTSDNILKIGDIAPDFKLKNIDNESVSLSDYQDVKGFVVVFTCNHCPFAVMYEDRLISLHEKYEKLGFPVVAINPNDPDVVPDDSFEEMQIRAKEKAFPFKYLFDENQEIYPLYGATKTPHVFLLDKSRKVKYIGAIDDSPRDENEVTETFLEDAINALIKGEIPKPNETKAIGCSIKFKK